VVDVNVVRAENPDVVVVACGATPIRPDFYGIDRKNVVYASDVLLGKAKLGKKVVILGGGAIGVETALFIAHKGSVDPAKAVFLASYGVMSSDEAVGLTLKGSKTVTILEMEDKIGRDIGRSTRWPLLMSLRLHGVEVITKAKVEGIGDDGVVYTQNGVANVMAADTVVIAVGTRSERRLAEAAAGEAQVYVIGDAVEPRTALEAIYEGSSVARQI
jgi:2,4-dienoyl-CoA reductase (NADPH2)